MFSWFRNRHSERDDFDTQWYLRVNPDVARAGVDPWQHYVNHGRAESRLPFENRAVAADFYLWRGLEGTMLLRLEALAKGQGSKYEQLYACWALARWAAVQQQWQQVVQWLEAPLFLKANAPFWGGLPLGSSPCLLLLQAYLALGQTRCLKRCLATLQRQAPKSFSTALAQCNVLAAQGQAAKRVKLLYKAWRQHGLTQGLNALAGQKWALNTFDDLLQVSNQASSPRVGPTPSQPCISVVVPAHNAAATLPLVAACLNAQTWPNIEVIFVNDGSTDNTAQLIDQLCRQYAGPGRVFRAVHQPVASGAYAARNAGMMQATGVCLTVHDADDWSHPQKLARQYRALDAAPNSQASVSFCVRASNDLIFSHPRPERGWVFRNESSLMIRRTCFEALGYWDTVQAGADSEYIERIQAAWGADAIVSVCPGVALAFVRVREQSLTQRSATHWSTQFNGARQQYLHAARRWHAQAGNAPVPTQALYVPAMALERPFLAPAPLCEAPMPTRSPNMADWVEQNGWFNAAWYVQRYPDLQLSRLDAFEHWWCDGAAEGRDPCPQFCLAGYAQFIGWKAPLGPEVLLHYLQGHAQGAVACSPAGDVGLPQWAGLPLKTHRPWVMVCAHAAGPQIFGAERGLVDILQAWQALQFNVVLVVPEMRNPAYLAALRAASQEVVCVLMGPWQAGRAPCEFAQARLHGLIQRYQPRLMYVNTSVLFEPWLVARACQVYCVVHAHELPDHDADLCRTLNTSAQAFRAHVLASADTVVVPGPFLAKAYGVPHLHRVPNVVNVDEFAALPAPQCTGALSVALISSNRAAKGVADFIEMARCLEQAGVAARCLLLGPHTDELEALWREAQPLPANIERIGYTPTAQQAVQLADVVVNMSHVQETFGRTLLEAMAAGRAVVAYDWGALPDLVQHEQTGLLVPFGNVAAAARAVQRLAEDAALRQRLGEAGRRHAAAHYSSVQLQQALARLVPEANKVKMDD